MLVFDIHRHWETDLRPITLTALRQLEGEALHFRPPGWERSAWDLAVHMAGVEWDWIYRIALRKEPWSSRWDGGRFRTLPELLAAWADIHRVTVEWLKDSPVTELNRKYPLPYIETPYATMNWIIYHVMEHEIHHRGQLFALMRMQGIKPPEIAGVHTPLPTAAHA